MVSALLITLLRVCSERRLPSDMTELVWKHVCAFRIQGRFLRWHLWRHVHTPHWPRIRICIGIHNVRALCAYSGVRREWRTDGLCWTAVSDDVMRQIRGEAHDDLLWGYKSTRFVPFTFHCSS